MTNVITLTPPKRHSEATRQSRLIAGFAAHRRMENDVFWLKENAEVLGIFCAIGVRPGPDALTPYRSFYARAQERLQFFPQYYRFLISICLDLEDLGMRGTTGAALCDWAASERLAEAELSDLQRGEARRLLARRGCASVAEGALDARLHGFINRSETFALPNKKAAYELTHIVFYLSEYGRRDPGISGQAVLSLEYAGLLAFLDQNLDLLAEVCVALRYAGQTPSPIWEQAVQLAHASCGIRAGYMGRRGDQCHEFLVTGWAAHLSAAAAFAADVPEGPLNFTSAARPAGPLRAMSERMFELGEYRSRDWHQMRAVLVAGLGPEGHRIVQRAEASTDKFEGFFEEFARSGTARAKTTGLQRR